MATFSYQAISESGEMMNGTLETEDISSAYDDLAAKGLHVIKVKPASELFGGLGAGLLGSGVTNAEVIEFIKNLSLMMRAGVPILTSLDDVIDTTDNKKFRDKIIDVRRSIEMGSNFTNSLEAHKGIFPNILIRLVSIGEETGQLDRSLNDAAEHLEKIEDLKAAIKKALMYPAFVITATGGALLFWMVFVLPKILEVLLDMGVPLPPLTLMLVWISDFLQSFWFTIPLIPAAIFTTLKVLQKYDKTRFYIDTAKLKIPIVKLIVYNELLALFCEQMRILILAGLTIDRCFDIVEEVMGNMVFQKALHKTKEDISTGTTITDSLKEHAIFPPLLIRMVGIGESSGSLDSQFAFLANHYLKVVDDTTAKLEKMIEPIVMVIVGGTFAVMMVGLMLPIYDLISVVGQG